MTRILQAIFIDKYNWLKYAVYREVNIRFTKVDDIIGLNKLLRYFIRIIGVNFDMFVSENLRFTVYRGLIVTSVCRGNFNRLKVRIEVRSNGVFGLSGFGLSGLTLYYTMTI